MGRDSEQPERPLTDSAAPAGVGDGLLDHRQELDAQSARRLANSVLDRARRRAAQIIVAALVIALGSAGWLVLQTASAAQLQQTGVHVWARIDSVYDGKGGAWITVSYPASRVYVSIPLWLSSGSYHTGERVRIAYDRSDPSHAVMATGLPTPGGAKASPSSH